ncbi:unnamed protein product, partial [marine sediment metagenome]
MKTKILNITIFLLSLVFFVGYMFIMYFTADYITLLEEGVGAEIRGAMWISGVVAGIIG